MGTEITSEQIVEAVVDRIEDRLLDHCEKIGNMVANWTGYEGAPIAILVGLPMKEGMRLLTAGSKDLKAGLALLERTITQLRERIAEEELKAAKPKGNS